MGMKSFKDKVVVVTGAGSGMGRSYATEFARLGAKLALNDYDAKALQATVDLLPGVAVHPEAFDVGDREAMNRFAAAVKSTLGAAHVIINNAGIEGVARPVWATAPEAYERIMRVNYFGVVNGTQAFLPQLEERGEGAIVNVSSIFGLVGTPNHADYCASKFAVRGFTEALMVELTGSPITAHLVHPGGIATNINRLETTKPFGDKYLTTSPDEIVRHVIRCIRWGVPKIVYGHNSFKTWLGANVLPLRFLNPLIWHDMQDVIDMRDYPPAPARSWFGLKKRAGS